MSRISANRRRLYGLGLGALLFVDLAGGAAAVVARASGPGTTRGTTPGTAPARLAPPAPAPAAPAAPAPAAPAGPAPAAADPNAGAAPSDCGQGTATALAVLDRTPAGYVLRATVANNADRTIELDRLVVQATYADGARTFAAAAGLQVASGITDADVALPESASAAPPLAYGVADFAFHTAGRPDCAAR